MSLDAQRERIAAWCKARGDDLAEIYVDAGLSGGRADNRPGLQRALDDVTKNGGVLIVYAMSRLARSTKDAIAIADRLRLAKANLASITEDFNTSSAMGKFMFQMVAILAELERTLIAERTQGAMNHKRGLGQRLGSIPFGSRLAADGKMLEPEPAEQETLALIRGWASTGLRSRAIARRLDEGGIPTKRGNRATWVGKAYRAGWSPQAVALILDREGFPTPEENRKKKGAA